AMRLVRSMLAICTVLLVVALPIRASAQNATAISYGQTIKGELTDAQQAIAFTFKAAADDVAVITMRQYGSDSAVSPHLIILDSKQQPIADSSDQVALYSVNLAAQLGEGNYTITATSTDDKSKGKFELALAKATKLTPDSPVKGQASSESFMYYAFTSGSPFILSYAKQGGDFVPTITVNRLDNHALKSVGTLGGEQVSKGSLGISPKQNELYIFSVGEGLLDINIDKVTADFSLTVTTGK